MSADVFEATDKTGRMDMRFLEIGFKMKKKGICTVCKKRGIQTQKFFQTISPWNQKPQGQIMMEERVNADKWLEEQFIHAKCLALKVAD